MKAVYATDEVETDRVDRGFRIERVVRDLTDPKRRGDVETPFKLGDQILITYRVNTRKLQNYVALEDALPAGLETVNPDLAMIGKFFEIPPEARATIYCLFRIQSCETVRLGSTLIPSNRGLVPIRYWRARQRPALSVGRLRRLYQCMTAAFPVSLPRVYASSRANSCCWDRDRCGYSRFW